MSKETKLTVTLPAAMVAHLEFRAAESGVSVSEYLEIILDEEIEDDPTPYCIGCGAKLARDCRCGDFADND